MIDENTNNTLLIYKKNYSGSSSKSNFMKVSYRNVILQFTLKDIFRFK